MATLEALVRQLSGASVADVPTPHVTAALQRHRMRLERVPIRWEQGSHTRGVFAVWGLVQPATDASAHALVQDAAGVEVDVEWSLQSDGVVIFAAEPDAPVVFLTCDGFDVHAAAAEVVDELLAQVVRDVDVRLGDQSFAMGQAHTSLAQLAASLRRRALPRSMQLTRVDAAPSLVRRRRPDGVR